MQRAGPQRARSALPFQRKKVGSETTKPAPAALTPLIRSRCCARAFSARDPRRRSRGNWLPRVLGMNMVGSRIGSSRPPSSLCSGSASVTNFDPASRTSLFFPSRGGGPTGNSFKFSARAGDIARADAAAHAYAPSPWLDDAHGYAIFFRVRSAGNVASTYRTSRVIRRIPPRVSGATQINGCSFSDLLLLEPPATLRRFLTSPPPGASVAFRRKAHRHGSWSARLLTRKRAFLRGVPGNTANSRRFISRSVRKEAAADDVGSNLPAPAPAEEIDSAALFLRSSVSRSVGTRRVRTEVDGRQC